MEGEMTTREKIIFESLRLFSEKGYDGVSMREIAAAVGIKGASIYNHFKGKEAVFQEIFIETTKHYSDFANQMNIPSEEGSETVQAYLAMEKEQLLQMAEGIFSFFAKEPFMVMFRKLIVSEQNKADIAAKCLKEYYIEAPMLFQTEIFKGMLLSGDFRDADAEIMALHFYSPIYYTLCKYDLEGNYEECLDKLKKHVHWFCELYRK